MRKGSLSRGTTSRAAGGRFWKTPGAKISNDPRLTRNTEAVVTAVAGRRGDVKTGHAFIKERMRTE